MTCRQPSMLWIILVSLVALVLTTAGTADAKEWPLEEKLRQLKQLGFELVATVEGTDIPIRDAETFKKLPESPAPSFKLIDLETGKEIPIEMEKGLASWGKALWEGLCDAAGLGPNCNGFTR